MTFIRKLFGLSQFMKQHSRGPKELAAGHRAAMMTNSFGELKKAPGRSVWSLFRLGSKVRRPVGPELSYFGPSVVLPCSSWGERKKATGSIETASTLFPEPRPWCWWGGMVGWGIPGKQTSAKARLRHSRCILMPRSSQNESLEDLGLWVWKAGWEPAHLLWRCRNIRAFFLYLVSIHLLEKNIFISILTSHHCRAATCHLSPQIDNHSSPKVSGRRSCLQRKQFSRALEDSRAAAGGLWNPQF